MRKNIILVVLMLMASVSLQAQTLGTFAPELAPQSTEVKAQGLSSTSAMLMVDLTMQHLDSKTLAERYRLVGNGENLSVNAFIHLAEGIDIKQLGAYDVTVKSVVGNTYTLLIPLGRFAELAMSGLCSLIDIGAPEHLALNQARATAGVNRLYNGTDLDQRYTGNGVVVGIVDNGFEYAHPAFYDSTGTTLRVKRAWNQKASSGTPPSGYDYGAEYTSSTAIINAQRDMTTETHGTHVAGIAAGCGGNNATGKTYRGVAPAADIVLVTTTMSSAGTFDGIQYIINYANSVNKPCVINLSLGSHVGPHDGTSQFDQICDQLLSGSHGQVLVGAAGNEGGDDLHISKNFSVSDTLLYTFLDFQGSQAGYSIVDIWGAPNKNYQAAVGLVETSTGNIISSTYYYLSSANNYSTETLSNTVDIAIYQNGTSNDNNRQNITFGIDASSLPSGYRVLIAVESHETQTLHMWGNTCTFVSGGFNMLTDGNTDYTVGETGGSGNSMLTVGSYVTRNEWECMHNNHTYSTDNIPGTLSDFSSHGPTLDGRVKPDILAPGEYIVAPINRFNSDYVNSLYTVASTSFNGHTEYYAAMQGTSMATPFMTGVVALWLQHNPNMSFADAKNTAHSTAISDVHTGTIPSTGSNLYGWGKVNVLGNLPYSPVAQYTVTLTRNVNGYGNVSGANGTYASGAVVTLTATPTPGHQFLYWADNYSNDNPRSLTVSSDTTVMAVFGINDRGSVNDQCVVTSFPYETHFDTDNDCWILQDDSGDGNTWFFVYDYGVDHTSAAAVEGAPNSHEYLASPIISQSGTYTATWKARALSSSYNELYGVYAYDNGENPLLFSENNLNSTSYVNRSVNFSVQPNAPVRLLFVYASDNKAGMLIDDVTVTRTGNVGIDDVADASSANISIEGLTLRVEGVADGTAVSVSDIMGRTLYTGNGDLRMEVPASGVYFVRLGDRAVRKVVAVR